MHGNANALAGLFTAVICLWTRPKAPKSHCQHLFELISMFIYILQCKSHTTRLRIPVPSHCFGPRGSYDIEKSNMLLIMRNHRNNVWFRQFFCCNRSSFDAVTKLLASHPVFRSTGRKPQRPVWHQLAVFLQHYGNVNQHNINTARDCSVGQGSVFLYMDRVITVLQSLGPKCMCWPKGDVREEVKAAYADVGFPGCLGAIDGSLIRLAYIPEENPIIYYCRKKFYGVNVSCIVDAFGKFINYDIGWPGSQNDQLVHNRSHLHKEQWKYFTDGEYLLGDRGYATTNYLVRPYSDQDLKAFSSREHKWRIKWNQQHSRVRIMVEHTFGALKGRFPALKLLNGQDMKRIYMSIEALLILHNIFVDLNNPPKDIDDYDESDPDAQGTAERMNPWAEPCSGPIWEMYERQWAMQGLETGQSMKEKGVLLRDSLLEYLTC